MFIFHKYEKEKNRLSSEKIYCPGNLCAAARVADPDGNDLGPVPNLKIVKKKLQSIRIERKVIYEPLLDGHLDHVAHA